MNKSFLITEQERKRIIGMHTYATRTQHLNEIYEGGIIQKGDDLGEIIRVSTRLSRAGQAAFSKDSADAATALARRRHRLTNLVTWLWQSMGPDVKLALRNDPDAKDALDASDVYKLWPCIMKAATTEGVMKSVSVLARTFAAMMSSGESHMVYVDRLQKIFNLFGILFESSDPHHKGYVKLETLYSVLYLNGLDKLTYEFIMNIVSSTVTDVNSLPPFTVVSQTIQT